MPVPSRGDVLEDVPANYEKFYENWHGQYRENFEDILQKSDSETLGYITTLTEIDPDETSHLFQDILNNRSQAVLLYTIYRFISGKKLSVRSLARRCGDNVVDGTEFRYILKKLVEGEHDFVYKLEFYNTWIESNDIYAYSIEEDLPDDYLDRFEEGLHGVQLTLARRTRSTNYTHDDRDVLEFEDGVLLNIDRQTSDQAKRDWSGTQRRRNISNVFIEINEDAERIRIGTSNTNIREVLREKLQDLFDIFLYDLETDIDRDEVNKDVFVDELTREFDEADQTRILAIEFEATNVSPASPLKVSKKTYDRDIRPIIRSLSPDVVSVELDNVGKLWVQVGSEQGTINVQQSVQESFLRLKSNIDTQREDRKQAFRNQFHESFGVPVDKKIPLHWVTGNRQSFIAAVLKNPSSALLNH